MDVKFKYKKFLGQNPNFAAQLKVFSKLSLIFMTITCMTIISAVISAGLGFNSAYLIISKFIQKQADETSAEFSYVSNAYLLDSIIDELPQVESLGTSSLPDTFTISKNKNSNKEYDTNDDFEGMGGVYDIGRSILLSGHKLNNSSTLLNKLEEEGFSLSPKFKDRKKIDKQGSDLKHIDSIQNKISRIPIGSPAIGRITSTFGRRNSPFSHSGRDLHAGIDIAVDHGTPVYASADGIVTTAKRKGGYGKLITIEHPSGYETLYAHLSNIFVSEGDEVCRGQQIGLIGSTGRSTGPHLHYEVRENGTPIDPSPFIELAHVLRFAK